MYSDISIFGQLGKIIDTDSIEELILVSCGDFKRKTAIYQESKLIHRPAQHHLSFLACQCREIIILAAAGGFCHLNIRDHWLSLTINDSIN